MIMSSIGGLLNLVRSLQNTEYRIQNIVYRIQDTGYRIPKVVYIKLPMYLFFYVTLGHNDKLDLFGRNF